MNKTPLSKSSYSPKSPLSSQTSSHTSSSTSKSSNITSKSKSAGKQLFNREAHRVNAPQGLVKKVLHAVAGKAASWATAAVASVYHGLKRAASYIFGTAKPVAKKHLNEYAQHGQEWKRTKQKIYEEHRKNRLQPGTSSSGRSYKPNVEVFYESEISSSTSSSGSSDYLTAKSNVKDSIANTPKAHRPRSQPIPLGRHKTSSTRNTVTSRGSIIAGNPASAIVVGATYTAGQSPQLRNVAGPSLKSYNNPSTDINQTIINNFLLEMKDPQWQLPKELKSKYPTLDYLDHAAVDRLIIAELVVENLNNNGKTDILTTDKAKKLLKENSIPQNILLDCINYFTQKLLAQKQNLETSLGKKETIPKSKTEYETSELTESLRSFSLVSNLDTSRLLTDLEMSELLTSEPPEKKHPIIQFWNWLKSFFPFKPKEKEHIDTDT